MRKNKYKNFYYSRVMRDLHCVRKQRDEIKNVGFTEIQIQFPKFVLIILACRLYTKSHATRVFVKNEFRPSR